MLLLLPPPVLLLLSLLLIKNLVFNGELRVSDQRKKLRREAFLTRNVKKAFLEALDKLPSGDGPISNTRVYALLLDACQNLTTGQGACFVEELVPNRQNFPEADVMQALCKVRASAGLLFACSSCCPCLRRWSGELCRRKLHRPRGVDACIGARGSAA